MSRFSDYWASQCGNPRGIVGSMITWAMNRTNKDLLLKRIIRESETVTYMNYLTYGNKQDKAIVFIHGISKINCDI